MFGIALAAWATKFAKGPDFFVWQPLSGHFPFVCGNLPLLRPRPPCKFSVFILRNHFFLMLRSRCASASKGQHLKSRGPTIVYSYSYVLFVCVLFLLRVRLEICSANKTTTGKVNYRPHLENAVEKKEPVSQKGQFCPSGGTMFVIRLHMAPFRNSDHKVKFAYQCWTRQTTQKKKTKRRPRTLNGEFHFMIVS